MLQKSFNLRGQCLLFYLCQSLCDRWNTDDDQSDDCFRYQVGRVVAKRIYNGRCSFRSISTEEYNAGKYGEGITTEHAYDISNLQTVFFTGKKSGKTQCAECTRITISI